MFSYLRYVYGVSFLLIVICAVSVGMVLRSIMAEGLEQTVMRNNSSLAQAYGNMVWRHTAPQDALKDGGQSVRRFHEQSRLFAAGLTASRFAVYNAAAARLFASHSADIYDAAGTPLQLKPGDPALKGQTHGQVRSGAYLLDAAGQASTRTVIQTFHPLPGGAAVEILTDISQQWRKLQLIQWVTFGSIVGIFLLLIAMLIFTTRRAESIIAKQHEINLELTAAAASAEAENRDKSQFLANISHELRTPLNAIIGFSEIIKKEAIAQMAPAHQEYIRDIHGSGIHLLSLINDILDFSKAEAGKLEVERAEVDVNKLVINSMRLVIPRAESAQVTLVEDLPEQHVIAIADAKKLKQVLLNLLSNAVKFTPAGGEVRVSAWEQVLDNKICIQVRDTGIGIAPKDIAKVMTPFGQVDNTLSRKYEGTGLGLPLSKKFVEIMGGEFVIESEVNVGTAVTLKLPGMPKNASYDLKR